MEWNIPGTALRADREEANQIQAQLGAMFLAGGLTLSQVASISGLEPHTIQNWVKRGFLPPPQGKRYDRDQLCRILNMNVLRGCLPLEETTKLMSYLNGDLADVSDDLVDDSRLYTLFVQLAARARHIGGTQDWEEALDHTTQEYPEKIPGTREKLRKVLKVMLVTWCSNQLRSQAEEMIAELSK